MDSYIERFAKRVREVREKAGLSQEELARQAGLHRTAVSLVERGKRAATLETIYLLAAALDVKPGDLLPDRAKRHELFDGSDIE